MAEHHTLHFRFTIAALFAFWTSGVLCKWEGIQQDCPQNALPPCNFPMKGEEIYFGSKKEEVDKLCSQLQEGIQCINDYAERCLSSVQRSTFNKLYMGTVMVTQDICQDGPYRDKFLQHSPCMKSANQSNERCAKPYAQRVNQIFSTTKINGSDEFYKLQYCCSLYKYLNCSKEIVLQDCGEETADFAYGFLEKMAFSLIEDYCVNYPRDKVRCIWDPSKASQGVRWAWGWITLLPTILFIYLSL